MTLNTIDIDVSTEKFTENCMVCGPELKYLDRASENACSKYFPG